MSVEQLALIGGDRPELRMSADGWISVRGGAMSWTHPRLPGVQIQHCGHPTANRPYHIVGPNSEIAQKFYDLAQAKAAAFAEQRTRTC